MYYGTKIDMARYELCHAKSRNNKVGVGEIKETKTHYWSRREKGQQSLTKIKPEKGDSRDILDPT